jgi:Cof subfamily protein (haloacid dehalogenase superfamily)
VTLDMDGTILLPDGSLSQRVIRAIHEARARGVVVALATSRRWTGTAPIARALELDGPMILYDGAIVRRFPDGAVEMQRSLDAELVRRAVETLAAHELQVVTQHSDAHGERMAASKKPPHPKWMQPYLKTFKDQAIFVALDELPDAYPETLRVVSFGPEPLLRAAFDGLGAAPVGRQILPLGSYGVSELTVFAPSASKGAGLRWLAQQLDIPMAQTLAIGDGVNDISMLREAGLGVAMGNAAPEVQAAADTVTAANDEDGAALALERFVFDADVALNDDSEETA